MVEPCAIPGSNTGVGALGALLKSCYKVVPFVTAPTLRTPPRPASGCFVLQPLSSALHSPTTYQMAAQYSRLLPWPQCALHGTASPDAPCCVAHNARTPAAHQSYANPIVRHGIPSGMWHAGILYLRCGALYQPANGELGIGQGRMAHKATNSAPLRPCLRYACLRHRLCLLSFYGVTGYGGRACIASTAPLCIGSAYYPGARRAGYMAE